MKKGIPIAKATTATTTTKIPMAVCRSISMMYIYIYECMHNVHYSAHRLAPAINTINGKTDIHIFIFIHFDVYTLYTDMHYYICHVVSGTAQTVQYE